MNGLGSLAGSLFGCGITYDEYMRHQQRGLNGYYDNPYSQSQLVSPQEKEPDVLLLLTEE